MLSWLQCLLCLSLVKVTFSRTVRQCAGSSPIYLLDHSIPDLYRLPRGVSIRYEEANSLHAFHLGPHAGALRVRASNVFTKCSHFPEEFSILSTLRMNSDAASWADEYVVSVIPDAAIDILLALRVSRRKVTLNYRGVAAKTPPKKHIETDGVYKPTNSSEKHWRPFVTWRKNLFDDRWHTLVVTVAATSASLRVDCGPDEIRRIDRSFPSFLDVTRSSIHVGNRKIGTGQFTGLIKQLLILPGGDASVLTCPAPQPNLPPIAWKPEHNYEADAPAPAIQSNPSCTWSDTGKMRYDIYQQDLLVCLMGVWQSASKKPGKAGQEQRLDYIQESSRLPVASPSIDMEVFTVPGLGTVLASACHDGARRGRQSSMVYLWESGSFRQYQNLTTDVAQAVKHFRIKNKVFLAVANMGGVNGSVSTVHVYRYAKASKRFRLHQQILTHTARGLDFATIEGNHYLAIANHRRGHNFLTESYVMKWNSTSKRFVRYQSLVSQGALDVTFMATDLGFVGLAIANGFSGNSTRTDTHIFEWRKNRFHFFHAIETFSASDVEFFHVDGDYFIAVANALNYTRDGNNHNQFQVKSPIYKLTRDKSPKFELFQLIDTFSIFDWEFFTVGGDKYLIASNLQHRLAPSPHNGESQSQMVDGAGGRALTFVYRWQGAERFVPAHKLRTHPSADYESFTEGSDTYFVYANSKTRSSEVFKAKMV